ncbi:MAG: hypothetical protein MJE77_00230 [Proteobacteria bacterium]|nr:hypothetical protein [Pseudomonadota bacterium]
MDINKCILQELVYQRVRSSVNLCQLVVVEQELDSSIQHVMRAQRSQSSDQEDLTGTDWPEGMARAYVEGAWRRLETEWRDLRRDFDDVDNGDHGDGEPA